VRGDWSTNPDNRILVNRCIHCFAVAIAEREVDASFPVNRLYQPKRGRFPKTDCGCGCGGSGDCGCDSKILGLPEPKLIQGCDTDCYVEPLTSRTQRTPTTGEGVPAYQTFDIPTIQFGEKSYRGCSGDNITITLVRTTSQGFNNATVSGFPADVQFPFVPEFRTSSQEITLDYPAGEYLIGLTAIASGNFGELVEATLEVVDCAGFGDRNLGDLPCPESEFIDFGGGECEGSYFVGFRQTGNINPDGTCEQIKVLLFDPALDCPIPEDTVKECESTQERDCTPRRPDPPKCVNTGSGDGFNSNAGYNAVVKVRTGNKTIEYLRPDKKECGEKCEFAELAINVPSCPDSPRKPAPAPFCPIPVNRYLGWQTESDYLSSAAINGITVFEAFACDDGTKYVLLGYSASCMTPANRYVDSFEAANYGGNAFGEGCCPFDETKPPRPECPPKSPEPVDKWACSGGICSLDANGTYNSQSECEAALSYSYTILWTWQTFNLSCDVITGFGNRTISAPRGSSLTVELGDFQSFTCSTSLFFMDLKLNGVSIDNRAGGGNSCFSVSITSVTENTSCP
jgi:hypothetical protein